MRPELTDTPDNVPSAFPTTPLPEAKRSAVFVPPRARTRASGTSAAPFAAVRPVLSPSPKTCSTILTTRPRSKPFRTNPAALPTALPTTLPTTPPNKPDTAPKTLLPNMHYDAPPSCGHVNTPQTAPPTTPHPNEPTPAVANMQPPVTTTSAATDTHTGAVQPLHTRRTSTSHRHDRRRTPTPPRPPTQRQLTVSQSTKRLADSVPQQRMQSTGSPFRGTRHGQRRRRPARTPPPASPPCPTTNRTQQDVRSPRFGSASPGARTLPSQRDRSRLHRWRTTETSPVSTGGRRQTRDSWPSRPRGRANGSPERSGYHQA